MGCGRPTACSLNDSADDRPAEVFRKGIPQREHRPTGTEPQVRVFRIGVPRTVPVKGAIPTNPGPARALLVESVACPAIRKVRAECLTAWAQLRKALVAERRPGRPVPPMAGTAAIGGCASAGHRHRGGPGPVLDDGILAGAAYRLLPARRPGLTSGVGPRTGPRPPARTTGCRGARPDWRAASSPCCRRRRTGPGPAAGGSLRRPTAAASAAEW